MKFRWRFALGAVVLVGAVVWAYWPSDSSTSDPGAAPAPAPESVLTGKSPTAGMSASPAPHPSMFLSGHESTVPITPSEKNVDSRVHTRLEQLKAAVAADSNDVESLLELARLSQDSHDLDDAIILYERIADIQPRNREVWLDLTRCYGMKSEWDGALKAADGMLAQFPDDPSALYNKGAILANTGKTQEAIAVWTTVANQSEDVHLQSMAAQAIKKVNVK